MIDYKLLDDSVKFYNKSNFARIESPWTVSEYVDSLTRPKDAVPFQLKHNDKCLVASGEQSFLYLYLKDFLPLGRFQTITPCFRLEAFDFSHTKYFMKNELIQTDTVNEDELIRMVELCASFYKSYLREASIIETEIGFDIMYRDHELGSYGIRSNEFLTWIYGTGCAEPRLSKILNKYGISY